MPSFPECAVFLLFLQLVPMKAEVTNCDFHRSRYSIADASNETLWVMSLGRRVVKCISRCFNDGSCTSVLVNRAAGQCRGLKLTSPTPPGQADTDEAMYTPSCKPKKHHIIGQACSSDSDCNTHMEGTGCYSGTCYCRPRLLYSPSAGACTLCTTFGTTFSVYPNHGVKSNNDERFYNVDSVKECQKICLEVKENTCRSAEYTAQKTVTYMFLKREKPCYISFVSMEDMRKSDLIGADNGWTLNLRDCE